MAFAIVHFLTGASVLLLLAAPLALRSDRVHDSALLLVTVGGLWGLAPDIHHFAPVFREQFTAIHGAPFADFFAFHYTLDLDPVRERQRIAVLPSVVLFCVSVLCFTAATRIGTRYADRPVDIGSETVSGILAAAGVSTVILGTAIFSGGYLDSLGMLTGRGAAIGWLLVAFVTTVAAACFGLLVELGPGADTLSAAAAAVAGLLLGVVTWLIAVVMVLPLFLLRFYDASLSLAHVDATSLVGFGVAGGALGATYVIVARRIREGSTRRSDQFSLQR